MTGTRACGGQAWGLLWVQAPALVARLAAIAAAVSAGPQQRGAVPAGAAAARTGAFGRFPPGLVLLASTTLGRSPGTLAGTALCSQAAGLQGQEAFPGRVSCCARDAGCRGAGAAGRSRAGPGRPLRPGVDGTPVEAPRGGTHQPDPGRTDRLELLGTCHGQHARGQA